MDSTNKNSVLKFDLTSKQIKFRDILSKDYLELEIYAISNINPNRNKSHFTEESLKAAVDRGDFKNKPIVGFFEKGDFTTHEGVAGYDYELRKQYWNTEHGERILGWVRESDNVEVVEVDDLKWIKFTCVLCTKYCYNQVKRLLKDRRKKVSVEITVNDSEMVNGIEYIKDFTINGTTILGSKNGKEVLEGIPDAHLSVLNGLDDEAMEEQRQALCFAYTQIDEEMSVANKDIKPKENTAAPEANFSGKEEGDMDNMEEQKNFQETGETPAEEPAVEIETENGSCGEQPAEDGKQENNSCGEQREDCPCEDDDEPENDDDDGERDCNNACGETTVEPQKDEEKEALMAKVAELEAKCEEYCGTIARMEQEACNKEKEFAELQEKADKAEAKNFEYFCGDLKRMASEIMSGEKLSNEDYSAIVEKCNKGEYSCREDIEKEVAYAVFKARPASEKRFSSSVENPVGETANKNKFEGMTREERIAARNTK